MAGMLTELERHRHHRQPREAPAPWLRHERFYAWRPAVRTAQVLAAVDQVRYRVESVPADASGRRWSVTPCT